MGLMSRLLRSGESAKLRAIEDLVPDIGEYEARLEALTDAELQAKTAEFRGRLDAGTPLDELLVEAFAVVREAAKRVLGQRHYDVQMMGGAALHFGWIAEMATGEGKTLVSTLPVYLNGLTGDGVHVVTVNDYLAARDAETVGAVHRWLGLTVGLVTSDVTDPAARRAAYNCDVTYGTNNEFGFDYLRDNMANTIEERVQRNAHFAIVDEVDSILIDEARTPLIISGPAPGGTDEYRRFAALADTLIRDVHYDVDEEKRIVMATPAGIEFAEKSLGVENLYGADGAEFAFHLHVALQAKELFRPDREYLIRDGEVKIVDEFTGRVLEGRRWEQGLHQAVEAKAGVAIQPESQTLARVTLQNYFRMYDKLAGMTGTASSDAAEFAATYDLQVVPIPTHRPNARRDLGDLVFRTEDAKFAAVVDQIVERHALGQPILVGTGSVAKSEKLSGLLTAAGIAHNVLNAKQHTSEATVIAQAGVPGAVTVATNMAGRGVDILLGGNPELLARADVSDAGLDLDSDEGAELLTARLRERRDECAANGELVRFAGGLHVIGTERHESRRIDDQLRGRAGRQGDPGSSRFYLSLEDDLLAWFATDSISRLMGSAWDEGAPIEAKMITKTVARAQAAVEGRNAQIRKDVLDYDEVYDMQRKVIYARRNDALEATDIHQATIDSIIATMRDVVERHVDGAYPEDWDLGPLTATLTSLCANADADDVATALAGAQDLEELCDAAAQFALYHYASRADLFGQEFILQLERAAMLTVIDRLWREHLRDLDHLETGIGLRAAGQKDPLAEWRSEGYQLFTDLLDRITDVYATTMLSLRVSEDPGEPGAEETADGTEDDARSVAAEGPEG